MKAIFCCNLSEATDKLTVRQTNLTEEIKKIDSIHYEILLFKSKMHERHYSFCQNKSIEMPPCYPILDLIHLLYLPLTKLEHSSYCGESLVYEATLFKDT